MTKRMVLNPIYVTLSRRHWDIYLLPLVALSIIIGAICFWQTVESRFAAAPLLPLLLWGYLRFTTPREGVKTATIRSTPGTIGMLWTGAVTFLLFAAALTVDAFVFDQGFSAPLKAYHVWLFAPPVVALFCGMFLVARSERKSRNRS